MTEMYIQFTSHILTIIFTNLREEYKTIVRELQQQEIYNLKV